MDIMAALVQIMGWRRTGDKPLSEAMIICLCVTGPQWILTYCEYLSFQRLWQRVFKVTIWRASRKWNGLTKPVWMKVMRLDHDDDGFPSQKPMTRSFDVFFDLSLNKFLRMQSRRRWFETPSRSLWRHCNDAPQHLVRFRRPYWRISCRYSVVTWTLVILNHQQINCFFKNLS